MVFRVKAFIILSALFVGLNVNAQVETKHKVIKDMLLELKSKCDKNPELQAYFDAYKEAMAQKNYNAALDKIDKAILKAPDAIVLYELRGSVKSIIGDYSGAVADYDYVIAKAPNYVTYYNRGTTKTDNGDLKGALTDYDKSVALEPNYPRLYNNRANVKLALNDKAGADADLKKALSLSPENKVIKDNISIANNSTGGTIIQTGMKKEEVVQIADTDALNEKLALYDAFLKLHPNTTEVYFYRAEVRNQLGNSKGAISDYTTLLSYRPNNSDAYLLRADLHFSLGNYTNAIDDYSAVIRIRPTNAIAYNSRGLTYYTLKNNVAAKEDFNKAIEIDPDFSAAYINRAKIAEGNEDFEEALKDYEKALELNKKNQALTAKVTELKQRISKRREEVNFYTQYITYKPNEAKPYFDRGMAYKQLREYSSALMDFNTAIKLDTTLTAAYMARSEVKEYLKDFDGMIADMLVYLRKNPNDINAIIKLAKAYDKNDNAQAAITQYNKLITIKPNEASYYLLRATAYDKSKNYAAAITDYTKYISMRPDEADTQLNLAIAKRKNKDYAGAVATLNTLLTTNTNNAEAYYERAKINGGYLAKRDAACEDYKKAMDLGHAAAKVLYEDECK